MKVLLDMILSLAWLSVLSRAGHEVIHWSACGPVAAPDLEIMSYAAEHDYVILTNDLDFGTLLAAGAHSAPSVVQLRSADLTPRAVGDLVLRTLALASRDLEQGALVTIDAARVRLRVLLIFMGEFRE